MSRHRRRIKSTLSTFAAVSKTNSEEEEEEEQVVVNVGGFGCFGEETSDEDSDEKESGICQAEHIVTKETTVDPLSEPEKSNHLDDLPTEKSSHLDDSLPVEVTGLPVRPTKKKKKRSKTGNKRSKEKSSGSPDEPADETGWLVGSQVRVHGTSDNSLNGSLGIVSEWNVEKGRYLVRVIAGALERGAGSRNNGTERLLSLKPSNVCVLHSVATGESSGMGANAAHGNETQPNHLPLRLRIKRLRGMSEIVIRCSESQSIWSVKCALQKQEKDLRNIPPTAMNLLHKGKLLDDGASVRESGLSHNSCLGLRLERKSNASAEGNISVEETRKQASSAHEAPPDLPYGGDVQQAMAKGDREGIRKIFAWRKELEKGKGEKEERTPIELADGRVEELEKAFQRMSSKDRGKRDAINQDLITREMILLDGLDVTSEETGSARSSRRALLTRLEDLSAKLDMYERSSQALSSR